MKGSSVLRWAVLGLVALAGPAKADVLYDNLTQTLLSSDTASGAVWLAQKFTTDGSAYTLSSVTLLLQASTNATTPGVSIYSDVSNFPGSSLEALSGGPVFQGFSNYTFTSTGLSLSANSAYWVVLAGNGNVFAWQYTTSTTGTGAGFTTTWTISYNSGAIWDNAYDYFPYLMKVEATPGGGVAVPEPASMVLFGIGGLVAVAHRRRKAS